jgi:hypothetical protein
VNLSVLASTARKFRDLLKTYSKEGDFLEINFPK